VNYTSNKEACTGEDQAKGIIHINCALELPLITGHSMTNPSMKPGLRYLYFTVFTSGMTSLAVEFLASRLLGNVYGSSNLVWASIIGLILIYLTLGYFIGGKWADRSPYPRTFYSILAWAALTVGVIPVVSHPVLRLSAQAFDQLELGILFGSFAAVLVLFIIPVTLLGTASPFAIRLALNEAQEAGRISGKIYAISTLGSFLGTFLPVLLFIPTIGTYRSFLVFSGALMLVALYGLWSTSGWKVAARYLWMPVMLAIFAIAGLRGPDKESQGQIYETESAYNYIQVLQQSGFTMLRLNDGQGVHSIYNPDLLDYQGPWEQVLVAPFFNSPPYRVNYVKSMAIVGLAAGTTARQATAVFGDISIDGYEIDPKIVEVGRKYFDMNEPNLHVIIQDGRWGLEHSSHKYSIISVDAYRPPYIPWQLTTREFFQVVRDHLVGDGAMAINVGRGPDDRELIDALVGTIQSVFPSVYVMDVPGSLNSIVFATVQETQVGNLTENFKALTDQGGINPLLIHTMAVTINNLKPTPVSKVVFTDDIAPVEWITNRMILSFVLSGEVEQMK
jgi:predicted membrane-bound spermidine synthase